VSNKNILKGISTSAKDRPWAAAVAGVAVLIVATACTAAPSLRASGHAGSVGASAVPASTLAAPQSTGGLTGASVTLTQGSAQLTMSGGASLAFDLTLTSGILIPGSNAILVWEGSPDEESGDDSLRIQAPSQAGAYQSSGDDFGAPQIGVSTGRIGTAGVPPHFGPIGDECTVTLTRVDATGVEGSLACHGLSSTAFDQPVDVQATFIATP